MKLVIKILIMFFLFLIIVDIYGIMRYHLSFVRRGIYLLLLFIALLLIRRKISWGALLILNLYGIYNMWTIDFEAAEPTFMNITSALEYILRENKAPRLIDDITSTVPFYFNGVIVLMLFTKSCMRYFGILKKQTLNHINAKSSKLLSL